MKTIHFEWAETSSLAEELQKPLESVSVCVERHSRPVSVALWHADGTMVWITSKMHDIAKRMEVGSLQFKKIYKPEFGQQKLYLDASFKNGLKVRKLEVAKGGIVIESGIVLVAENGREVVIVPGVYPYSLAISGVSSQPHFFEPEYEIESYHSTPLI